MNEQLQVSLNYLCICLSYQNDYLNWHNRLFLANHSAWVYLWLHIWITQWIVKIWLWILIYNTINIAIKHFPTNDKIFWKNKYHNYVIKTTVKWKLFVVCYKIIITYIRATQHLWVNDISGKIGKSLIVWYLYMIHVGKSFHILSMYKVSTCIYWHAKNAEWFR